MIVPYVNKWCLIGQGKLAQTVARQLNTSAIVDLADLSIHNGQVLCWLPEVNDPVDDQVQDIVSAIDHANGKLAKIVVWSPAGTADDAQPQQLQQWWGSDWQNIIAAYLYMVKMIDELEYTYTVVRSLPIEKNGPAGKLINEEELMTGESVSLQAVADTIRQACRGKFTNQSIGVSAEI